MLYKELDNCDECPLYNELCSGGWTSGYGGTPIEPPCTCWNDEDDLDEIYNNMIEGQRKHEDYLDKKYKEEERIKQKKIERAKKAEESKWAVWPEQREINSLRKIIKNNNKILSFARNYASAVNFTNEAFGYKERIIEKDKNPLEIENEKLQEKIYELEKIKKEKLKQL